MTTPSVQPTIKPLTAADDEIAAALAEAYLPPLLPALAFLTGDLGLLRPHLRIDPLTAREPQGGLSPEQQEEIRALALTTLATYRDAGGQTPLHRKQAGGQYAGGQTPLHRKGDDALTAIMEFGSGGADLTEYTDLLTEELGIDADHRAPDWTAAEFDADDRAPVLIVGAGMSGIVAGHRLNQAGVPFVMIEKNADVGGTWLENTYPGCRVDVPNQSYSYSFAQTDWPQHHSPRPVLLEYFRRCADEFGLRPHIRFEHEVIDARWDDAAALWRVRIQPADGDAVELDAQAVISAVGQLNRPNLPDFDGLDDYAGPTFHSARWDHDVDLAGKRVAVVGTGASAAQFVPIIAESVAELVVFQRTPNWFFPVEDYHADIAPGLRWLFAHVPHYRSWYRFWQFWRGAESVLPACEVDPEWDGDRTRAVSALNDEMRAMLTMYLEFQYESDPELAAKTVPTYPVASKRVLVDNGSWAGALLRDNVQLVAEGIDRFTPTGLVDSSGAAHEVDVVIFATGFQASKFLTPMQVVGRDGSNLHDRWAGGEARAYLGVTVPDFPNFFVMYGPNTNIVVNGSIIFFSECETNYVLSCLELLYRGGHQSMAVKADVHDAFNAEVDAGNRAMVWGASTVNSWYKNDAGRVTQNWPFSLLDYWRRTRTVDPADYHLH